MWRLTGSPAQLSSAAWLQHISDSDWTLATMTNEKLKSMGRDRRKFQITAPSRRLDPPPPDESTSKFAFRVLIDFLEAGLADSLGCQAGIPIDSLRSSLQNGFPIAALKPLESRRRIIVRVNWADCAVKVDRRAGTQQFFDFFADFGDGVDVNAPQKTQRLFLGSFGQK